MSLTVGVDVGGTKVAAGVVDEDGTLLVKRRRSSAAQETGATEQVIAELVSELAQAYPVEAVGVGAPGLVDETRSVVRFAPNLAWHDLPLAAQLSELTGLPVVVENDANAAAWAEYRFGAARDLEEVVVVTVGTGIGGGLVLGGRLHRGRFGLAGEIGHLVLESGGRSCACGRRGCWEQYASGNALLREARTRAAEDRDGARLLLSLGDGTPEGVSGKDISRAAEGGDPVALAAFSEIGRWLGRGMAELSAVLDPGCFVVGGGVSEAGELLLGPARDAYRTYLVGAGIRPFPEIVAAELGNDAGLVGAADLARVS
jgi:glucokinase